MSCSIRRVPFSFFVLTAKAALVSCSSSLQTEFTDSYCRCRKQFPMKTLLMDTLSVRNTKSLLLCHILLSSPLLT